MKNRKLYILLCFQLCALTAWIQANDVASFVNLGFSKDDNVFMFAQYGIQEVNNNHSVYADIYTVNVPMNTFVSNGVANAAYYEDLSSGQDGSGALYTLLPTVTHLVKQHAINHFNQGRLIYLLVNGENPRPILQFRDFQTGNHYVVEMKQTARGSGASGSAAFHLTIAVTFADQQVKTYQVGLPNYFRKGINQYQIRQIVSTLNRKALVIVIEKITHTDMGQSIRYMVETLKIQ